MIRGNSCEDMIAYQDKLLAWKSLIVISGSPYRIDHTHFAKTVREYNSKPPFQFASDKFPIPLAANTNISIYISIYAAHLYDSVILYAKVKIKKDKEDFIFLKLLFEVTCLQEISIKIFCLGIISGSISLTENRPIYLGCLRQN